MSTKRIGLLGGAFNPPHLGHLKLAELALSSLGLDQVRFVPTSISLHKAQPEKGPAAQERLRMLSELLEVSTHPFAVEPLEIERGGTSYTVDTLEAIHLREPDCAWILLMGSDQVMGLLKWRNVDRILELASVAVAPRPGHGVGLPAGFESRLCPVWSGAPGEIIWLPGTQLNISSTDLRQDLAEGRKNDALPIQVRTLIGRENYYQ